MYRLANIVAILCACHTVMAEDKHRLIVTTRDVGASGEGRILDSYRQLTTEANRLARTIAGDRWLPDAQMTYEDATRTTEAIFRLSDVHPDKRSALQDPKGGDRIRVRWNVTAGDAKGELLLDDGPENSKYILRVRTTALDQVVAGLINLDAIPIVNNDIALTVEVDSNTGNAKLFEMIPFTPKFPFLMQLWCGVANGEAVVELSLGKGILHSYYSRDTLLAPERFPPLTELAKSWSNERIVSELSQHPYPPFRDKALLNELIKRPVTAKFLVGLVQDAGKSNSWLMLAERTRTIVAILPSLKSQALEQEFEELAVDTLRPMGSIAGQAIGSVMLAHCTPRYGGSSARIAKGPGIPAGCYVVRWPLLTIHRILSRRRIAASAPGSLGSQYRRFALVLN